jgi:tetratricopeptide (TPR) repeat protein
VLRYARIAEVRRGGAWIADPKLTVPGETCGDDCRVTLAPLNTDDNMRIEFAAPRDLIGFSAYENYVSEMYALDWPFGRLEDRLGSFGRGEQASRRYSRLAYALMAAAREEEAGLFIERAEREARTPDSLLAMAVFGYLYDPRTEPTIHIETPTPGPELARSEARHLDETFQAARAAVDRGEHATALSALRELPSALLTRSGPGLRFLHAYLLVKTAGRFPDNADEAVGKLEDLVREDPDYVARHPEVYFVLARAHRDTGDFGAAVETMRMFVESRLEETSPPGETLAPTPAAAPNSARDPSVPAAVTNP